MELQPDYPEALSDLAYVLTEQGTLNEAVACCRRALDLRPDYAEALNNLGHALQEQGRLEEALAACRQARQLRRTSPRSIIIWPTRWPAWEIWRGRSPPTAGRRN